MTIRIMTTKLLYYESHNDHQSSKLIELTISSIFVFFFHDFVLFVVKFLFVLVIIISMMRVPRFKSWWRRDPPSSSYEKIFLNKNDVIFSLLDKYCNYDIFIFFYILNLPPPPIILASVFKTSMSITQITTRISNFILI